MEGRLVEYRPLGGGLDYHHNSPLIGEIPPAGGDYTHAVHRSIDQLRNSLNERVTIGPLSVFSNTADLRSSVLTYSNQQHHTQHHHHHQQQQQQHPHLPPPPQHQQQHLQAQQQQHHPQINQYNLSTTNHAGNNNNNNSSSVAVDSSQSTDSVQHQQTLPHQNSQQQQQQQQQHNQLQKINGTITTTTAPLATSTRSTEESDSGNTKMPTAGPSGTVASAPSVSDGSAAVVSSTNGDHLMPITSRTHSGSMRGRKAKIYPHNPNQHIITTSNSVDNGGARHHHNNLNENTSTNGISSSTSSPQHHLQQNLDVKDSKIFGSKADLQLHTQIHMREAKPYKCTQCAKAFANSSYLSQHTRIHLGIKPYRCEICQRKFTQLSHLQQHIRTHTGDKPYKCRHPGCQKAFSQLSNLQSHSRCHQTDKPFKCNSCYKCFSDEPSLLEHIPKHKESKHLKTHICQYCGKSYTQETYLTKHMQKHAERTDKRPPIVVTNTAGGNSTISSLSNPAATTPVLGPNSIGGSGISSSNHNRGNLSLPPVTIAPAEHSYWPKVSPDSAANLSEVMHQQQQQHHNSQQQQQQQHHHHQQHQQQQQQQHHAAQHHASQQQQQHHQSQHSQQHMDFPPINPHQAPGGGSVSGTSSGPTNGHIELQAHHPRMSDNGREDIVSTPSTVGPYDAAAITKTSSNSAFTPINSMTPHLNSLGHHPMAQRPYLYDAISFQNKNVNQNNTNGFPNQLISLHQIRNYAHQPAGLMTGDHLLGVSVGPGKDKG